MSERSGKVEIYSSKHLSALGAGSILKVTSCHPFNEGSITHTLKKSEPEEAWQGPWLRQTRSGAFHPVAFLANDSPDTIACGLPLKIVSYTISRTFPDARDASAWPPENLDPADLEIKRTIGHVVTSPREGLCWRLAATALETGTVTNVDVLDGDLFTETARKLILLVGQET